MKVNTTYECENCHKIFNTKEELWGQNLLGKALMKVRNEIVKRN